MSSPPSSLPPPLSPSPLPLMTVHWCCYCASRTSLLPLPLPLGCLGPAHVFVCRVSVHRLTFKFAGNVTSVHLNLHSSGGGGGLEGRGGGGGGGGAFAIFPSLSPSLSLYLPLSLSFFCALLSQKSHDGDPAIHLRLRAIFILFLIFFILFPPPCGCQRRWMKIFFCPVGVSSLTPAIPDVIRAERRCLQPPCLAASKANPNT